MSCKQSARIKLRGLTQTWEEDVFSLETGEILDLSRKFALDPLLVDPLRIESGGGTGRKCLIFKEFVLEGV